MKLTVIRIEENVVTCQVEDDGTLIDIGRQWLNRDISLNDVIEVDITNMKK